MQDRNRSLITAASTNTSTSLAAKQTQELRAMLASPPVAPGPLARLVMATLSHYFQSGTDAETDRLAMGQWVAALQGIPAWAVVEALNGWVATEDRRRPTPASIKKAAENLRAAVSLELKDRARPAPESEPERPPLTPEARARMAAAVAAFTGRAAKASRTEDAVKAEKGAKT